jgi:hypothetical protein
MQEVDPLFIYGDRLLFCPEIDCSSNLKGESPLQGISIIFANGYLTMILQDDQVMSRQGGCYSQG